MADKDLISRQAALRAVSYEGLGKPNPALEIILALVRKKLVNLPAIEAEPKWISVKERLPDETKDEYVLVVCDYHGTIKVETRKMWNIESTVTHWMPMPEPPK